MNTQKKQKRNEPKAKKKPNKREKKAPITNSLDSCLELLEIQDELIKTYDKALLFACEIVSAEYEGLGIKETKEDLKKYFLERANKWELSTNNITI